MLLIQPRLVSSGSGHGGSRIGSRNGDRLEKLKSKTKFYFLKQKPDMEANLQNLWRNMRRKKHGERPESQRFNKDTAGSKTCL